MSPREGITREGVTRRGLRSLRPLSLAADARGAAAVQTRGLPVTRETVAASKRQCPRRTPQDSGKSQGTQEGLSPGPSQGCLVRRWQRRHTQSAPGHGPLARAATPHRGRAWRWQPPGTPPPGRGSPRGLAPVPASPAREQGREEEARRSWKDLSEGRAAGSCRQASPPPGVEPLLKPGRPPRARPHGSRRRPAPRKLLLLRHCRPLSSRAGPGLWSFCRLGIPCEETEPSSWLTVNLELGTSEGS